MVGAVLAHVEGGAVEAVHGGKPLHGSHFRQRHCPRSHLAQRAGQEAQVGLQFLRTGVGVAARAARPRQARQQQVRQLPPRFAGMRAQQAVGAFAEQRGVGGNAFLQFRRRLLHGCGETQPGGKRLEALAQHAEGPAAQRLERMARCFRGDERMAVAVAAHPASKGQSRLARQRRAGEGPFPGFAEALREQLQHSGEHVGDVVERVVDFRFHARALEQDLTRPPEPLQAILDAPLQGAPLHGTPGGILPLHQHEVNLAVTFQHAGALGFSGMGREHGLHVNAWQHAPQVRLAESRFPKQAQLIRPGAGLHGRPPGRFLHAAHLVGRVLLYHGEELERHGERLRAAQRQPLARPRRFGKCLFHEA